ncbi:glycosyltransferase family 8 protein [Mucilaginibacter jinjuensis]|uniref:Glycosyltransferase family 8 protein n=1 Tax=Mucilaginibacter jinjuensis TaxID=1176721 RepID=A0ABY7TEF5_9SPHI|nr:glycosyltransferase family 8 protein [Mucilaginibacter jinjuensis]WCT14910.1 glycosyltransferase family 8 protein [Mucilaginibacter jinjuensis]
MKPFLNVIFTIDQKFLQHFSAAIVSLLENNRDIDFNVFIIHDIEKTETLDNLVQFIKSKYNVRLNLIFLDNSIFENYRVSLHYSKAVYFRLLFTEILPKTIDKALFLDSDLIVTGSVKELAEYQFKDEYLLAVDDAEVTSHVERLNKLGFPIKRYFNAGVLLINFKAWRADGVAGEFIGLANQYMDKLEWWDQDILNMYFYNGWQPMNPKYNAIHLRKKLPQLPVVVHYAGPSKPWLYIHEHPYKNLYWEYLKLTPFKNTKYQDYSFKEFIRKGYIKILNLFHLRPQAVFKDI